MIRHVETVFRGAERLLIVFPVHSRTCKILDDPEQEAITNNMLRLLLCDPLGYFDFGKLVSGCRLVITDSGGIQEESTVYAHS
jgi:UDP-N-acetylglucosamine 2-epimerase (non-hydrolysing)